MEKNILDHSLNGKMSVFILLIGLFMSCSSEDTPKGVLTHDQMVPIFLDVYLAEGKVNDLKVKRDSSLALFEIYEQLIFEKHEVSDSIYRLSMSYYYDHPDQLEMIYETVLDSLNLLEKRLEEKKEKDSEGSEDAKKEPAEVVDA